MTLILDLYPLQEQRLVQEAQHRGVPPVELAKQLVTEHLPPLQGTNLEVDEENAAAIALLNSWL